MPRYTVIELREFSRYLNNKRYVEKTRYIVEYMNRIKLLVNEMFQRHGGIAFNLHTGGYIALTNGISEDAHRELLLELDKETQYGVRMASVTASNPLVAFLTASAYFSKGYRFVFEKEDDEGEYWVMSLQLFPHYRGYDAYTVYNSLYSSIHKAVEKYGGLLVENIAGLVVIIGGGELESLVDKLTSIGLVGVGVSTIGCKAYENALKALQLLIDGALDGKSRIIHG